jgi:hypothetical protein
MYNPAKGGQSTMNSAATRSALALRPTGAWLSFLEVSRPVPDTSPFLAFGLRPRVALTLTPQQHHRHQYRQ